MATITIKIYDEVQPDGVKAAQVETIFDPPMAATDDETLAQGLSRRVLEYIIRITGSGAYALEYEDGDTEGGVVEGGEARKL